MKKIIIKLADFSKTPGGRYKKTGPFSGEEFKEQHLDSLFQDTNDESIVEIYLDGVSGHPSSFLDGSFGELARQYGKDRCLRKLRFISTDNVLVGEIKKYINSAQK